VTFLLTRVSLNGEDFDFLPGYSGGGIFTGGKYEGSSISLYLLSNSCNSANFAFLNFNYKYFHFF